MSAQDTTCGIGRCRATPDMTAFSVPICQPHWNQCCAESAASLTWLRKKARVEYRGMLAEISKRDPSYEAVPARGPRPRESKSSDTEPVRIDDEPVCISKPRRRLRSRRVDHVDSDEPVRITDEPVRIP